MTVSLTYDLQELDRLLRRSVHSATTAQVRWGLCIHHSESQLLASLKCAINTLASPESTGLNEPNHQSESTILPARICGDVVCDTVSAALVAAQQRFDHLLVREPAATDEQADVLLKLLTPQTSVTATIDHFYHAELLARAAQRHRKTIGVFIEVDAGRKWNGVRPGYDAQRLAIAASRLDGLNVLGVFGPLPEALPEEHTGLGLAAQKCDAVNVLRHTLELIRRECPGAQRLFLTGHPSNLELIPCHHITDFADSSLLQETPVIAECRILSRPTLQRAVLNAGWAVFNSACSSGCSSAFKSGHRFSTSGDPCQSHFPEILGAPGATMIAVDHCSSLLDLTKQALDLTIGDAVRLRIR
ncbi:MAG: alanine racemase [Planctomyces sp.]|nr:alanine racemase [Planctomyces sp.]